MARFAASFDSYAAPAAVAYTSGTGLTFTTGAGMAGYLGALVNGTTGSLKLRKLSLGCRVDGGTVPTSCQVTLGLFRQTTRGAGSTGWSALSSVAAKLDTTSNNSTITALDTVTAASPTVSTVPVIEANPFARLSFNTQSGWEEVWEGLDEVVIQSAASSALGIAIVNLAASGQTNTLPASHRVTVGFEWEE